MKQGVSLKERLESTNPCIDEYKDVLLSASIAILEMGVAKNGQTPMFEEMTYVNEQNGQYRPLQVPW